MAAYTVDPFTQIHDRLWERLIAHPRLAELVKPGNQVDYTTEAGSRPKPRAQPADFPELRLVPVGADPGGPTSSHRQAVRKFLVVIITGDRRIDRQLNALDWAIWQVLEQARQDQLGLEFVGTVVPGGLQNSMELAEYLRNVEGWGSVWSVTVKCLVPLQQMLANF